MLNKSGEKGAEEKRRGRLRDRKADRKRESERGEIRANMCRDFKITITICKYPVGNRQCSMTDWKRSVLYLKLFLFYIANNISTVKPCLASHSQIFPSLIKISSSYVCFLPRFYILSLWSTIQLICHTSNFSFWQQKHKQTTTKVMATNKETKVCRRLRGLWVKFTARRFLFFLRHVP